MPFNIEDFKAYGLSKGGARPSLFEVEVPGGWPQSGDAHGKTQFLVKAASIPPSIVEHVDVPYFGRKIKVTGDRVFPNWSITVLNEEDYTLRNGFMNWHEHMNSKVPNLLNQTSGDISQYKKDLFVRQYSKPGLIIFECKIVGAFPVTIDVMNLDWDATNQIQTFDVELAYDYWIAGDAISSGRAVYDPNYLPTTAQSNP